MRLDAFDLDGLPRVAQERSDGIDGAGSHECAGVWRSADGDAEVVEDELTIPAHPHRGVGVPGYVASLPGGRVERVAHGDGEEHRGHESFVGDFHRPLRMRCALDAADVELERDHRRSDVGVDDDGGLAIVDERTQGSDGGADLEAAHLRCEDPVNLRDGRGQARRA